MTTANQRRVPFKEGERAISLGQERRDRSRAPVRWLVHFTGGGARFQCVTRDLSCEGFYCIADRPLPRGSSLACTIIVPAHESGLGDCVHLECDVEVVRAELADAGFGIACRIQRYSVIAQHRLEN